MEKTEFESVWFNGHDLSVELETTSEDKKPVVISLSENPCKGELQAMKRFSTA